jgi:uracil-DNA glycosylase
MMKTSRLVLLEPCHNCQLCPRLVELRIAQREVHPDWHNAPVPNFSGETVKLLIVGLAPGLQGANRTGRPFTGDWAGDLLYETLFDFGFATGNYAEHANDGLQLIDCAITNTVRCVPPQNKPTPAEITQCRPFLQNTIASLPDLKIIVSLGRIAHESTVRALGFKLKDVPFVHGAQHKLGLLTLVNSYHCSRYNTNTGKLTRAMFRDVFEMVREL